MITVIDYGMSNLRSVVKALERFTNDVTLCSDPENLKRASKIVLPGVGAFGDCIRELKKRKLFEPLREILLEKSKPYLGICLGLQVLFKESEENPDTPGLDILGGRVARFQFKNRALKIPHMGWNTVSLRKKDSPLVNGVPDKSFFYFVHSYYAKLEKAELALGETEYGGIKWVSAVSSPPIFAVQFHPEKSQQAGLKILENFVKL